MAYDWSRVEEVIRQAEADGINVGVAVITPDGDRFAHRGDDRFHSASTIKIAIMIELFRAIDRGETSLEESYILQASDNVPGSGVLQELHDGITLTLRDVVYLMISISDNPATNILIDRLGIDAINATMRELSMTRSVLGRKMRGRPAIENEQENLATPNEFAGMVKAILEGGAASPASCEEMIALLKLQQNTRRIGRFVPAGAEWGSKTGSYETVVNDVGFIMREDGPVVVSVFTSDVPDMVAGELLVSEITRAVL